MRNPAGKAALITMLLLAALTPSMGWELLESEIYLGVPGVPTADTARGGESLQTTNCNCNQAGCGCSSNLYCANTGLCYQCSQYNCNNRPSGCGCGQGMYCGSTGQCSPSCNCQAGWICGADGSCQHPSTCSGFSCNGYGTPIWTGSSCSCSCNLGFDGNTGCGQCSYGYNGYPNCQSVANCNGYSCGSNGSPYWQGGTCTCICNSGFTGISCTDCSAGYSGYPYCRVSSGSQSCSSAMCSGRGTATWDVTLNMCTCGCNAGYTGASCDRCATGYTSYPYCSPTSTWNANGGTCTSAYCSNHGVASWRNNMCVCTCHSGFAGVSCNSCDVGYYSYPYCSPGGGGVGWVATPTPQTFITPTTRGLTSGGSSSDDDLPAAVIAVIVVIAVCLVIAGIAAIIYTRRRKKKKPTDPAAPPEFEAVSPPAHVYGGSPPPSAAVEANPIGGVFHVPPPPPPLVDKLPAPLPPPSAVPQSAVHG